MRFRIGLLAKLCLTGVLLVAVAASPANALDVSITGLRNVNGDVVVCVWRAQDKGFPNCGTGSPWKKLSAPASNPRVTFGDLPPGAYAVSMFHDEKRTGKPETNLVGLPMSGVGLANNPSIGPMNPPTFEKGRVAVPDTKTLEIAARYLF